VSCETLTISSVVENGGSALRRLYAAGISSHDFALYEDEFKWVERRIAQRKTINRRVFRQRFPDFEWDGVPTEDIKDLAAELKEERAFEEVTKIMSTLSESLEKDNALELAVQMREQLSQVTRAFRPMSDVDLDGNVAEVIREMRQGMILAKQGMSLGIPTGFPHLDHHWGGLLPGIFVEVLGRTGEGKSLKVMAMAWAAKKASYRVGFFTPEFDQHQSRCRYHTIASADKKVQKDLELERSFRNRALLFKRGFNLKAYQRFLEYMDELPGRVHLLSGQHMSDRMSVGYIEDRIVELELDLVIVDPIYLLKPVRTTRDGNGWQETAWTAESLHHLSEQYSIPIVFTNQANDKTGAKDDAPHKSSGFGSQQMTHLADYVLGVKHRSDENVMSCRGSKSRFGSNFRYDLKFYANTGVIKNMTPLKGSYFNGNDEDANEEDLKEMVATAIGKEDD
jgi:RecA/RadA recombinase